MDALTILGSYGRRQVLSNENAVSLISDVATLPPFQANLVRLRRYLDYLGCF